jgi:hypothetical protein
VNGFTPLQTGCLGNSLNSGDQNGLHEYIQS